MGFQGLRGLSKSSLASTDTSGAVGDWFWTLSIQVHMNSWKKTLFGRAGRTDGAGLRPGNERPRDSKLGVGFLDLLQWAGSIVKR